MSDALFLLDGYSVIYRSYFAMMRNPLRNSQGQNTSAIVGFVRAIHSIFKDHAPSHFAVAMDPRGPTFRHERYPEYKANREKAPEDLHDQVPVIDRIMQLLKIPVLVVDGFEADDIMATLARRCADSGRTCRVVTGDKDLLQLVGGGVDVLKPGKGRLTSMDTDAVLAEWGVQPNQILDYLSLVGDSSDNVPGVKGIGAKTAASLLGQFDTLDEIYAKLDAVKSAGQRTKLEEGRESAYMSRDLITLRYDVPLPVDIDDLAVPSLDVRAAAPTLIAEGARSLVRDLGVDPDLIPAEEISAATRAKDALPSVRTPESGRTGEGPTAEPAQVDSGVAPQAPRDPAETAALTGVAVSELNRPGSYTCVKDEESLRRWVDTMVAAGECAFDCETDSLDAVAANPVGFSLCCEWGTACYIPLLGPDGPVLNVATVRNELRRLLEDPSVRVIGQNIKYDYKVMRRWGVTIANVAFDTMIAAWLAQTNANSFGMDALSERYLGYTTVHYADAVGDGDAPFSSVDLESATRYAAEDADVTFRLARVLAPVLDQRQVTELFVQTEMPLVPLLGEIELAGIRLDTDQLSAYGTELTRRIGEIEANIHAEAGHSFNIGSTKQLQEVLFSERKLQPVKKTKTGFSTDNSVLQILAKEDPIPELVLQYRQLTKLKSTYVEALPKMVNGETGRVHTHLNQTGTATGRLSSTDPNLQNIPIRDDEGRRIRMAFVAGDGCRFVSADYAQIELVVLAHLSGDPGLRAAFGEGEDVHRRTAALLFGREPSDVTHDQRRIAKTINFGVMYGMSAFRMSNELGISRGEAQAFIDAYFTTYSAIRSFVDRTVQETSRAGEIRTLLGRPRPIPDINNRNKTVRAASERVATNTPIQGSAADIVKRAMLAVAERLRRDGLSSRIVLQVHDELILECPREEVPAVKALLVEEMSTAVDLEVPLRVSVESGTRWGEMHE